MKFDFIVFDVDGVLADSLGPHIQFCQDEAKKFGIQLPKKSPREIVDNPMEKLLLKAGFPEELVSQLIKDYMNLFPDYRIHLFDGVPAMLIYLKGQGRNLAIASSNRIQNIRKSLGPYFKLFNYLSTFDLDHSKSQGLIRMVKESKSVRPVFVGDTEKDYHAAKDAGLKFIGVSYGWQITSDDKRFPVARSADELVDILT